MGSIWEAENHDFSRFFGVGKRSKLISSESYKTLAGAAKIKVRHLRTTSQKRQKHASKLRLTARDASNALGQRSRAPLDRPERPPKRSWTLLGRSWRRPWAPKTASGAIFRAPKPFQERCGAWPKRTWRAKTARERFGIDFGTFFRRFCIDFSCIFHAFL